MAVVYSNFKKEVDLQIDRNTKIKIKINTKTTLKS